MLLRKVLLKLISRALQSPWIR